MPEKLVLRDVSVRVDGVLLTESARSVDIDTSADELDVTAFGGSGWREFEPGLKAGQISVEFFQGFDANGVYATLWPLAEDPDNDFEVRIGPKGNTGASDNPVFVARCKMFGFHYLQGEVGAASTNPVTFRMIEAPTIDTT
jgi:hypothetical protein